MAARWRRVKTEVGDRLRRIFRRERADSAAAAGDRQGGTPFESHPAIAGIEKKIWQLILLAIAVILYLTFSLIGLQFLGVAEIVPVESPEGLSATMFPLFLGVLVLLFSTYLIVQQRRLLETTKDLFRQQQEAGELSRSVEILSALLQVSSSINDQQRLGSILTTIACAVRKSFEADRVSIMLIDASGRALKTMTVDGQFAETAQDALVPLGKGVAGWVVAHGKPLLLQGEVDPVAFPDVPAKKRAISSAMCVPLKIGPRCIGVLNVNLMGRDAHFSANDLQMISIFGNSAAIAINNARLLRRREEQLRLKMVFEQLHSPRVVKELVEKAERLAEPGGLREKRTIGTLFADIRGFSEMSAELPVDSVMGFLDAFYGRMALAVADNEGILDKFIGDEVMAFFGAPESLANVSRNAMKTAIEMMHFFSALRDHFSQHEKRLARLGLGIGINTGTVTVGSVGSRQRAEYTVIGEAVNLARRLCTHARPGEILVGQATRDAIADQTACRFAGEVDFKGFAAATPVYRVEWEVRE